MISSEMSSDDSRASFKDQLDKVCFFKKRKSFPGVTSGSTGPWIILDPRMGFLECSRVATKKNRETTQQHHNLNSTKLA